LPVYGFPAPYDCVKRIERWRKSEKPVKLTITGTDIDLSVSIESLNTGEEEGTGDVYYSLELKEYKYITLDTKQTTDSQVRPVTKEVPQKYTVKAGDTLWMIAQRQYGDGSRYPSIAAKNGIKNPNLIYPGQVLTFELSNLWNSGRAFGHTKVVTKIVWSVYRTSGKKAE
jgi:nucleoid-associated protein YgaU